MPRASILTAEVQWLNSINADLVVAAISFPCAISFYLDLVTCQKLPSEVCDTELHLHDASKVWHIAYVFAMYKCNILFDLLCVTYIEKGLRRCSSSMSSCSRCRDPLCLCYKFQVIMLSCLSYQYIRSTYFTSTFQFKIYSHYFNNVVKLGSSIRPEFDYEGKD